MTQVCGKCHGSGMVDNFSSANKRSMIKCPECNGKGLLSDGCFTDMQALAKPKPIKCPHCGKLIH